MNKNHTRNGRVAREQRQHDANLRDQIRKESLLPSDQVVLLDQRLGKGVGARRERARLEGQA